jgi:hypothetical protein
MNYCLKLVALHELLSEAGFEVKKHCILITSEAGYIA